MNAKHYSFEDNEKNPGYGDVANMECIAADVSLAGVKFAFDRQYSAMTECDMGSLELICLLKKGRPFVIFKVGAGENSGCDAEATVAEIEQLSRKLGLERASPAELVATLLAAVCPNFLAWPPCYCEDYAGGYFDVSRESHPILTEAVGLLADPWRRRGSDKPGVPPESGKKSFRDMLAGVLSAKIGEVTSSGSDDEEEEEEATEPETALSPSDDETATFKRASEETLRQRRIVSVSGRFKAGGAPAAAKSDPDTSGDDPDDASLDLVPEPREETTQDSGMPWSTPEELREWELWWQREDDCEEKAEDDATAARTEARLERSLARRRCDVCGLQAARTERPFQVCNGCRGRRYCSRECQKADWASHKQSCAGYNADV
jgi:hypothetical protein